MPDIWRAAGSLPAVRVEMNAHDLLRYAVLLRSMRDRFHQEDGIVWFDDALFFLRGGFDFWCYLNLSSNLTLRGRIFGGLNHARAPAQKLEAWFERFTAEARARGATAVDVFVAEEINSGSSAHRIMNVVDRAMSGPASRGTKLTVDFWFYLACTDASVFDPAQFASEVASKRRMQRQGLIVRNNFRLFQGPLIAYDEERYSGLRVLSKGGDTEERYASVRHRATTFHAICPTTKEQPFWCASGDNDLDNFVGVLVLDLLGFGGGGVVYRITADRIARQTCEECKALFAGLRATSSAWTDRVL